ncbi:MAG: hypothetical protein HQL24_08970 [Candidatus Omnitrophica bacterium]|nr:hypothetical protein [Candidatus Omnitrophota bacterium]
MTMNIRSLIRQLLSSFLLLNVVRGYKSRSSLVKIKAAQAYVFGVKKTRAFFLGALFVSVSFVFLINGLSLIQTAFFTYSMWSSEVKFLVALLLGGIEFLVATVILIYLFREETWGKFTEIQKVVNLVVNEEGKGNKKEEL